MGGAWFMMALPDVHGPWRWALLAVEGVFLPWVVYSFVTEDPKVKAQREVEQRHRQIRALERELGFEPLDLDWPEPMLETRKEKN